MDRATDDGDPGVLSGRVPAASGEAGNDARKPAIGCAGVGVRAAWGVGVRGRAAGGGAAAKDFGEATLVSTLATAVLSVVAESLVAAIAPSGTGGPWAGTGGTGSMSLAEASSTSACAPPSESVGLGQTRIPIVAGDSKGSSPATEDATSELQAPGGSDSSSPVASGDSSGSARTLREARLGLAPLRTSSAKYPLPSECASVGEPLATKGPSLVLAASAPPGE